MLCRHATAATAPLPPTDMPDSPPSAERRARLLTRAGFAVFWGLAVWTIIAAGIGVVRGVSQADDDGSGQWAETR